MTMPNRTGSHNSQSYRYGAFGHEKDDEVKGDGNTYDFGARSYDPRLGRFKSIDPYTIAFPSYSPYAYALNSPLILIDEDGMFPKPSKVLADFGIELPPLAAGILDGASSASPLGMLGFVYDLTTDSQFRSDMVDAFSAIANDPVGAMKIIFEEYADVMERVMAGEATDEDLYFVGEEVGAAIVGLITGGAIAKYSKKLLNAGKPKGKVVKKTVKQGEFGYISTFDGDGRLINVSGELQLSKKPRLKHDPNTPGKQSGDHAGHMIADRFGGSPGLDNLVSQAANLNLSGWKKMENLWAKSLEQGKKVTVDIKINYSGGNARPSSFDVSYTIDGETFTQSFKNN